MLSTLTLYPIFCMCCSNMITYGLSMYAEVCSKTMCMYVCVCLCPVEELAFEQLVLQTIGLQLMVFNPVMGSILGPQ